MDLIDGHFSFFATKDSRYPVSLFYILRKKGETNLTGISRPPHSRQSVCSRDTQFCSLDYHQSPLSPPLFLNPFLSLMALSELTHRAGSTIDDFIFRFSLVFGFGKNLGRREKIERSMIYVSECGLVKGISEFGSCPDILAFCSWEGG